MLNGDQYGQQAHLPHAPQALMDLTPMHVLWLDQRTGWHPHFKFVSKSMYAKQIECMGHLVPIKASLQLSLHCKNGGVNYVPLQYDGHPKQRSYPWYELLSV